MTTKNDHLTQVNQENSEFRSFLGHPLVILVNAPDNIGNIKLTWCSGSIWRAVHGCQVVTLDIRTHVVSVKPLRNYHVGSPPRYDTTRAEVQEEQSLKGFRCFLQLPLIKTVDAPMGIGQIDLKWSSGDVWRARRGNHVILWNSKTDYVEVEYRPDTILEHKLAC